MNKVTICKMDVIVSNFQAYMNLIAGKSIYYPGLKPFKKSLFGFYDVDLIIIALTSKEDLPEFKALIAEVDRPEILCMTSFLDKGDIHDYHYVEFLADAPTVQWFPVPNSTEQN